MYAPTWAGTGHPGTPFYSEDSEVAGLTRGEGILASVPGMADGTGLLCDLCNCLPGSCLTSEETQEGRSFMRSTRLVGCRGVTQSGDSGEFPAEAGAHSFPTLHSGKTPPGLLTEKSGVTREAEPGEMPTLSRV